MKKDFPPLPPGFGEWRPLVSNPHRRTYFWIYQWGSEWSHPERSVPQFIINGQAVDVWVAEPTRAVKFVSMAALIIILLVILTGLLLATLLAYNFTLTLTR